MTSTVRSTLNLRGKVQGDTKHKNISHVNTHKNYLCYLYAAAAAPSLCCPKYKVIKGNSHNS